ncbi:MAG: MerR family transcriptional regulator [Propionivibrio sp.]|uniref:chaperone modulator CbpM n=1 Tax=Propionivibrio sp. TaxID=2212460 RepID=UPI001A5C2514|nr:chaperone modulator CbpM [Propionivibrio sp.]MBL8416422.1 MerR family transcriptional regulator [Propionivibrio sp.]
MENDKTEFQSEPAPDSSTSGATPETRMLPQLSGIILEELRELTLAELCRACAVRSESIVELVEEGVLAPNGREPHRWRFSGIHMHRATVALRLQRDLGVNLAGAALALQLLDEVEALRARLKVMGGY